jgi:hypothetical protein
LQIKRGGMAAATPRTSSQVQALEVFFAEMPQQHALRASSWYRVDDLVTVRTDCRAAACAAQSAQTLAARANLLHSNGAAAAAVQLDAAVQTHGEGRP